jgi:hypothetical protein
MKYIPYCEAIGSLLYVAICIRPEITFAVCALARFVANPKYDYWVAVTQVIEYFKGTKEKGLQYQWNPKTQGRKVIILTIVGFLDSSFNDDIDTRKSTMRYAIFMNTYIII